MVHVIASDKPWPAGMPDRLQERLGTPFVALTEQHLLSLNHLRAIGAERVFLPHWSHIIPEAVLKEFECIVFHMADLPYGRSGSPLQSLIVRGHEDTVISALRCTSELDGGPIYLKRPLSLDGTDSEIFSRSAAIIEEMIENIVLAAPHRQQHRGEPTIFKRRTPEEGSWEDAATLKEVYDRIRILDAPGYPRSFVDVGRFRLSFNAANRAKDSITANAVIHLRQPNMEKQ